MIIELRESPYDPYAELGAFTRSRTDLVGKAGANAVFIGTMRDFNEGDDVTGMFLEHYPGMTERELERLCTQCSEGAGVLELLVLHRIGAVEPGEHIVLVAAWTAHRAEAFRVCRDVMEALKHRAPFWKKENLGARHRWVEKNTPG